MNFQSTNAPIFYIPDNVSLQDALQRTTHVGIVAHSHDLEIMASHGIIECFDRQDAFFLGIVLTNSANSPCNDPSISAEERITQRTLEQKKAALVGNYSAVIMLNQTSDSVRSCQSTIIDDLVKIIDQTAIQFAYIHNPFDRHNTHLGASILALKALRKSLHKDNIHKVFGCEVWGGLEWLPFSYKCSLDVSKFPHLTEGLIKIFHSQIHCGKRYDLATVGRRMSNATFLDAHEKDTFQQVTFALNMLPLLRDQEMSLKKFMDQCLEAFVSEKISNMSSYIK